MNPASPGTLAAPGAPVAAPPRPQSFTRTSSDTPFWQRVPVVPFAMAAVFAAFMLLPRINSNPRLLMAYGVATGFLGTWTLALWALAKRRGQALGMERVQPRKQHYIQSTVQFLIYVYWGFYWREVYHEAPLILSQFVFLYTFDALLGWTRGRNWVLGFGPLPIVLSTNIFIWFHDDVYLWQFALVTTGALGKEFIKWNRDGRRTHIFNPSAFTLFVFSVGLILTGRTDLTWAREIAVTIFRPPHIYLELFVLGLIVQYFFQVTLMTLSAVLMLCIVNLAYFWSTGTYYFVDSNIPVPIFLGLTFLVTDPSTSPRTRLGRVIFGSLYALGAIVLFRVFESTGVPSLYDKLIPIPLLNLSVKWIDKLSTSGVFGRLTRWEAAFKAQRSNLVYMGCWIVLFTVMLTTGWVEAPHPGSDIAFWREQYKQGNPEARRGLLTVLQFQADNGSAAAWNELGLIYNAGGLVPKDPAAAARCFGNACELGSSVGCTNLATQFLVLKTVEETPAVRKALAKLEAECTGEAPPEPEGSPPTAAAGSKAYYLVGLAYESGRGRPQDRVAAKMIYTKGCLAGNQDACMAVTRLKFRP